MSFESGLAALEMRLTNKVPRVEYSAESHWPLVQAVTGIDTADLSNRERAREEFMRQWDYAFSWHTDVGRRFLEKGRMTKMGHAVYAELKDGRSDYDDDISSGFSDLEEVYDLDFWAEYGEFDQDILVETFELKYRESTEKIPDAVHMGGVYITLVSGFIEILGWEMLLLAMGTDPDRFSRFVDGYAEWVEQFFTAFSKTNIPVFMCHDDMCWSSGPVAHPEWYRRYIFPHLKKLLRPLKDADKKVLFTSDGNYTVFFDDIVRCGVDMLVMEPLSDMALFAEKYGNTHGFTGNADTRVLLSGSRDDINAEVKRCMDIGRKHPGFIMAVGNHIPQNTPVANALCYNEAYEKMSRR